MFQRRGGRGATVGIGCGCSVQRLFFPNHPSVPPRTREDYGPLAFSPAFSHPGAPASRHARSDEASLPNLAEDTGHTKDPVTKLMAVTALSKPGPMTENTSLSTDFHVDGKGLLVQQQPDKQKAMKGDDVVFSCLLFGHDPDNVSVQWEVQGFKEKYNVLQGNRTSEDTFVGRAFLSGNPKAGDFSMTLKKVSRVDPGIYHCVLTFQNGSTVEGRGTKLSI
ncbi:hypothetical protein DPEC_G00235160 [Dallia pectoralis]|uniref:Uncharacterized protein n=1 Tax=Dallia pectoralis TaxID=75939 RepID=A0ACC2FY01_DALPE|nr:hypothetical protein DPEC_G00235160 [Dallia pectoralis]